MPPTACLAPFLCFCLIGQLELMTRPFGRMIVPQAVYDEVAYPPARTWIISSWMHPLEARISPRDRSQGAPE